MGGIVVVVALLLGRLLGSDGRDKVTLGLLEGSQERYDQLAADYDALLAFAFGRIADLRTCNPHAEIPAPPLRTVVRVVEPSPRDKQRQERRVRELRVILWPKMSL